MRKYSDEQLSGFYCALDDGVAVKEAALANGIAANTARAYASRYRRLSTRAQNSHKAANTNVMYGGFEVHDQYLFTVYSDKRRIGGRDEVPMDKISLVDLAGFELLDKDKGRLALGELSPRRKRISKLGSGLHTKSHLVMVPSLLVFVGSAIASLFFPPALAVAGAAMKMCASAMGSSILGTGLGCLAHEVRYVEFMARVKSDVRVEALAGVTFIGRMPEKHYQTAVERLKKLEREGALDERVFEQVLFTA